MGTRAEEIATGGGKTVGEIGRLDSREAEGEGEGETEAEEETEGEGETGEEASEGDADIGEEQTLRVVLV